MNRKANSSARGKTRGGGSPLSSGGRGGRGGKIVGVTATAKAGGSRVGGATRAAARKKK